MEDGYDFGSAIKDVDRQMPEAAVQIRKYIEFLKRKANYQPESDDNCEKESE